MKLCGLEQWPELNGRIYKRLPSEIRKGLDRRAISYIVLLKESAATTDEEALLRQQVFERLNTGGVTLTNQEIRHCIYHGKFDELLMELTKHPLMRKAWGLPPYGADEEQNPPEELLKRPHFAQMRDAEIILRFFALRHAAQYRGGMQTFLDQYMVRARRFQVEDIDVLRDVFLRTIELAAAIYEDHIFHPWDKDKIRWSERAQIAYADAVMVGCSLFLNEADTLKSHRNEIIDATRRLFAEQPAGTFTGQKNTKNDVEGRINLFRGMLEHFAA